MATAFDTDFLKTFVECSMCLEKFDNPKLLKCSHQFCKACLEDVIVFRPDGSASVPCPLRCTTETVISAEQTVDSLSTCYEFKGILEALKAKEVNVDSQIPVCGYDSNCNGFVSVHCCELLMCKACSMKHQESVACNKHRRRLDVCFNRRGNKLEVVCKEHASLCTHLCMDGTFLCTYCLNRNKDHEDHLKNPIERDVALIREALVNDARKMEGINKFFQLTERSISFTQGKLSDMLHQRKEECLSRYKHFLNREEVMLINKFHSICENHMKQYSLVDEKYYQDKLAKFDLELAIQQESILNRVRKIGEKSSLRHETVSLSDNFNFNSDHPLGDITVTNVEELPVTIPPVTTLKDTMKSNNRNSKMSLILASPSYSSRVMYSDATCEETQGDISSEVLSRDAIKSSNWFTDFPQIPAAPSYSSRATSSDAVCDEAPGDISCEVISGDAIKSTNWYSSIPQIPAAPSCSSMVTYSDAVCVERPGDISCEVLSGDSMKSTNWYSSIPQIPTSTSYSSRVTYSDAVCEERPGDISSDVISGDAIKSTNRYSNISQIPASTSYSSVAIFNCDKSVTSSPSTNVRQAYFDVEVGKIAEGRIVIDLYHQIVPKTCTNFIQLCTHFKGYGYKGSKFHLINPGICCVGGDIADVRNGEFESENFLLEHDDKGIVSMKGLNTLGGDYRNGSRFTISMKAMPEFNGRNVVFGKVTNESYPVLEKVGTVNKKRGKPSQDIVIVNCGVLGL